MKDLSKGFDLPAFNLEGGTQTMIEAIGVRRLTVRHEASGVTALELDAPPLRKLVLSGGGAKGIAYPGAIMALENLGALSGIDTVYGSSAGAIMAALIASGLNARQFDTLADNIDLLALMDSPNPSVGWLQRAFAELGKRANNALPSTVGSFTQLLLSVLPRIQSSGLPLQTFVRDQARNAVMGLIADQQHPELDLIRRRLERGDAVTFGDLDRINRHLGQIKKLNITGTAMFEGRAQLVVFNATLTPDMDIAMAAHISAALPVVFRRPGAHDLDFQEFGELTYFQDGGVLLNTPIPQLIDPSLTADRLWASDMLILIFEKKNEAGAHRGLVGTLTDWWTGAPVSAGRAFQAQALKALAEQVVTVPLNTEKGDFRDPLKGTLNFTMTNDIKDYLQDLLRVAVEKHLAERSRRRERYEFASLDEVLHSLGDEMLGDVLAQTGLEQVRELQVFRRAARRALVALEEVLQQIPDLITNGLNEALRPVLESLDELATNESQLSWLVNEMNRPDALRLGRLLQLSPDQGAGSAVLLAAIAEARQRNIRTIAENIRRFVVFPSLHLLRQTDHNKALLWRVDEQLAKAGTAAEINQALDTIIQGYTSRNPLLNTPLRAKTIEMARAWRITDQGSAV